MMNPGHIAEERRAEHRNGVQQNQRCELKVNAYCEDAAPNENERVSTDMVQAKFSIESGIYSAFKEHCAFENVSMASVIAQFMKTKTGKLAKGIMIKTDTRPLRRKAVLTIIGLLSDILQMEERYRDDIPEQFESRYEAADQACELLAEAISYLEDAF